jgi:hypothetical protein
VDHVRKTGGVRQDVPKNTTRAKGERDENSETKEEAEQNDLEEVHVLTLIFTTITQSLSQEQHLHVRFNQMAVMHSEQSRLAESTCSGKFQVSGNV